jgi:hypothetical protein
MIKWAKAITVSFVKDVSDGIGLMACQIGLWPVYHQSQTSSVSMHADDIESYEDD